MEWRRRGHFVLALEAPSTRVKSAPLAPGFDGILYPGELEARYEARHAREGPELRAQAERLGLPWPPG